MHFGGQRVPKRSFLGSLFNAIPRLVAKVRMKLPCGRQHRFRGFRTLKSERFLRYFRKGSEGAPERRFLTLFTILGARRGPRRSPFWSSRALFLRSGFSMIFELSDRGRREGSAAGAVPPEFLVSAKNSVAIPSRPAAPLRGVRRIS